ncbi:hypothetical protein FOQG_19630 [Fusarium oxysporum f. sp. raphani 54005]|uniref:Uncharacterized protein n=2 Tax=Fusarium oxysporum TaxID=5507 RepID=X0B9V2_FUSOX|nr:hypothetical protein FOVG_19995 [Fusarium oxysporum f. sp. pisi HDV247]EXK75603.1 hypothetical protein FOQG_19630 [Fusarium oxysporum f. sp. raphani 54005]
MSRPTSSEGTRARGGPRSAAAQKGRAVVCDGGRGRV